VDPSTLDPTLLLVVLGFVGLAAAVVNTMAGGGSMLVIPVLLALGLPSSLANGTLRVGVAAQNLTSVLTFHRRGLRVYGPFARLVIPMGVGAGVGSYAATILPDDVLRKVFGIALMGWAVVLALRPGGFAAETSTPRPVVAWALLGAFAIGLYGGFLQVGVGFPLLALLVPGLGYSPVEANAIKVLLVLSYTLVALPIFAFAGQIAWGAAGVLALGSIAGGWLGARLQLRAGARLVRWVVVAMVCVAGVAMLLP
jgi:uncharacterized membrane protein YfcA